MGFTITIDTDKCTGEAECVDVLPVEVYEIEDGRAVPVDHDMSRCPNCMNCIADLRAKASRLEAEVARLRTALEKIANDEGAKAMVMGDSILSPYIADFARKALSQNTTDNAD